MTISRNIALAAIALDVQPLPDLSEANLSGADLSRASLLRANLYEADLSGAGRITVVLNNDEGRLTPDEPLRPVFPQTLPPPSRYLDGPAGRRRHRADTPDMSPTWPEALAHVGMWAVFSGIIVGILSGVVWGALYLLS